MLNILFYETAQELKENGSAEAKFYDNVTVMFTDFKDFTSITEKMEPIKLVAALDKCFKAFDSIMDKHDIEKIKTFGDNISGPTYEFVKDHFHCTYRGKIAAKNKGEIDMYFVEGIS